MLARERGSILRQNMKAERARLGLTIKQVADELNVHPNAVARWENGESEPLASNLIGLCNVYGCTPEYLLGITNDRNGNAVYSG